MTNRSVLDFKIDERVKVLVEYRLENAIVEKIGRTRLTVRITNSYAVYTRIVNLDRVAKLTDCIAVVNETWKGRNGRGAYRIERELYAKERKKADDINTLLHTLYEVKYGILV